MIGERRLRAGNKMSRYQGSVALVIAITLCLVLVVAVIAAALGVEMKELTRDTLIGVIGMLAGALISYLAGGKR